MDSKNCIEIMTLFVQHCKLIKFVFDPNFKARDPFQSTLPRQKKKKYRAQPRTTQFKACIFELTTTVAQISKAIYQQLSAAIETLDDNCSVYREVKSLYQSWPPSKKMLLFPVKVAKFSFQLDKKIRKNEPLCYYSLCHTLHGIDIY